ncbi:MAG: protein adenylyltransferase SelO family protein, partial [Polyangiaceae bacterium]
AYASVMRAKLGLELEDENDTALAADLLRRLAANEVDYTVFFRALCASAEDPAADVHVMSLFKDQAAFRGFAESWRRRLLLETSTPADRAQAMRRENPAFIARNHRVEEAITAGIRGDFAAFETLVRVLARPYDDQPDAAHLAEPPEPSERVTQTFCGT